MNKQLSKVHIHHNGDFIGNVEISYKDIFKVLSFKIRNSLNNFLFCCDRKIILWSIIDDNNNYDIYIEQT